MKFIVGIDEVGRGPLAGPVSVGIVVVPQLFDMALEFPGLTDSKKMTPKAREKINGKAEERQKQGTIRFGIFSTSNVAIDCYGIEHAIASAIACGLQKLAPDPAKVEVFLDGRLKAPKEYKQETIIRGDSLVPAISLASVIAKVSRDRFMTEEVHPQFPNYGFDSHKGYGTAAHFAALKSFGTSPMHRLSFLSAL